MYKTPTFPRIRPLILPLAIGSEKQQVKKKTPHFITEVFLRQKTGGRSRKPLFSHPPSVFQLSLPPVWTTLGGEISVYFLSWESEQVHDPFEGGDSTVKQQNYEFPMSHGHESLMSRCPNSVPGPIKRIWDGWAQHVVQIHFCNLRKQQ